MPSTRVSGRSRSRSAVRQRRWDGFVGPDCGSFGRRMCQRSDGPANCRRMVSNSLLCQAGRSISCRAEASTTSRPTPRRRSMHMRRLIALTFATAALGLMDRPARAQTTPTCPYGAGYVNVAGSTAAGNIIAKVGAIMAASGTTVVYSGGGSCAGLDLIYSGIAPTGTAKVYTDDGGFYSCNIGDGQVPTLAASDVFPLTCQNAGALTNSTNVPDGFTDVHGPGRRCSSFSRRAPPLRVRSLPSRLTGSWGSPPTAAMSRPGTSPMRMATGPVRARCRTPATSSSATTPRERRR